MGRTYIFDRVKTKPFALGLCLALAVAVLLSGCGAGNAVLGDAETPASAGGGGSVSVSSSARDAVPVVLVPESPGTETLGDDTITIDVSNTAEGYITVAYTGDNDKPKLRVYYEDDQKPYDYNVSPKGTETFPLSRGNGTYRLEVWEHMEGTQYSQLFSGETGVTLNDEFRPFLYPNQYVDFTPQSRAVAVGGEVAAGAQDELGAIKLIYDYVTQNITYDYQKAELAAKGELPGYLPNIDETLATKTGICFDYAALMAAMLRTQGLPSKLVIGYAGELYHAWIRVYAVESGKIYDIVFNGNEWALMDPTFAATGSSSAQYVGEGNNYNELLFY